MTRYAKKVDSNQRDIVAALRQVGAYVLVLNGDIDLLCFYRNQVIPIECKNEQGRNRLTATQKEMLDAGLPVQIVYTPEDALRAIGAIE